MSMKISTSIFALSLGILASSAANAADVYNGRDSMKDGTDVPHVSGTAVNWTGVYVGGSVGYGNANHNLTLQDYWKEFCSDRSEDQLRDREDTLENLNEGDLPTDWFFRTSCEQKVGRTTGTPPVTTPIATGDKTVAGGSQDIGNLDGLNSHGVVGDIRLGADLQRGRFVFGVFGAYGFNAMETTGNITDFGGFDLEKGEEWSVGARAGILVNPRTLAYVLAAYTQTEYDFNIRGGDESASKTVSFSGITAGAGVEFALTNNVFLGIEGTHTFYGEENLFDDYDAEDNVGTRLVDELGETKVMGTLKIKLNSGLPYLGD